MKYYWFKDVSYDAMADFMNKWIDDGGIIERIEAIFKDGNDVVVVFYGKVPEET